MEHGPGAKSWVQVPKYANWGFKAPKAELVKIVIDLRPKKPEAKPHPPPENPLFSLSTMLSERRQPLNIPSQPSASNLPLPGFPRNENQPPRAPGEPRKFHPFGNRNEGGTGNEYFGGPIIDKATLKWRQTHYTRACGDVIGADEINVSLPSNMKQVVKSVAVMSSAHMTQTALWIGPRLLLSTLHLHQWIQGYPSAEECDLIRKVGQTFNVESEISSQVLSHFSPKVQLLAFSAEDDIGVFKLLDHHPSNKEFIDPDWLYERDEVYERGLTAGRKVACVGYSGKIGGEDAVKIKHEATLQLQKTLPACALTTEPINLDMITKPSMKSLAPGTLDHTEAHDNKILFGVSASLWKGSSGGPCVLLDGKEGGSIIGLVRGYELLSDPYNLVNGFPAGLKAAIKGL